MSDHRRTAPLFVVNGLFATAVQYGTFVALVEVAHLRSAGVANGLASVLGVGASYLGNRLVVFRAPTTSAKTLPRFLLLYGVIAVMNAIAMWLWSDLAGLPNTPGFIAITGFATMVSYLGNRYFVFPPSVSGPAGPAHA